MNKHKVIFWITLTLFLHQAYAQDIHHLDLQTTIEIAKRQSPTMVSLMRQLDIAGNNMKVTMSGYKPQVSMSLSLPQYSETIRQYEDSLGISFYPIRQSYASTSLSVSQRLPTDGSISLRGNSLIQLISIQVNVAPCSHQASVSVSQ